MKLPAPRFQLPTSRCQLPALRFQLFAALIAGVLAATVSLAGQGRLDPAKLLKPGTDSWPTFNGDYSGRRFSPLDQINATNVQNLALSWATRYNGSGAGGRSR